MTGNLVNSLSISEYLQGVAVAGYSVGVITANNENQGKFGESATSMARL